MLWKQSAIRVVSDREVSEPSTEPSMPAFAPLVSDAFEQLKNLPPQLEVPLGVSLVEQGTTCDMVTLVLSGLVKLVCVNPEGRQATLGLRSSGWYAGAVFVLMNNVSVYSVITVTPCTIVQIPAHEFSLKLMQSARMTRHFTATLCNELISQSAAQAEVMVGSAEERLAHFMRERDANHPKWKVLDTLPLLKQTELAQLLSITPEHLSRMLNKSTRPTLANDTDLRRVTISPRTSWTDETELPQRMVG